MKTRSVLLAAVLAVASSSLTHAQKESDIISRLHTALLRGAEDIPTPPVILKGKFTVGNIVMDGIVYSQKNSSRIEIAPAGMKFITVQNDSLRWVYNPVDNSHKVDPISKDEANATRQTELKLDFASKDLLYYKARGLKLKSLGIKKIDSVETFALQLTRADKSVVDFFISTKTNLVYKVQSGAEFRIYARYQRHGEYMYPMFMSTIADGKPMVMAMTEAVMNASIDPTLFTVPKEAFDSKKNNEAKLEAMIAHADGLYEKQDYVNAINEYSTILREHGRVYRAFNGRGLCKIATEKYYEAVSDFNSALEIVPTGSTALNNRGLAKYYIGDNNGALEDYTAAISADSTLVNAFTNRALVYFNQEKYTEAAAEYLRAIRLQPNKSKSHYEYGITLVQLERYEEAIASYRKAAALGEASADFSNRLGVAYYSLENYDSAAVLFNNAIALDKENLQYLDNYGNTLYKLGDYKNAARQFERYISIKNDDATIYNMIGLCMYQEEDYKGAIQKFSKSIELSPKDATYFDNRASAKEYIEDYEGAISDYSQSISIYPNDPEIFYKRGLIKIRTSKKLEGCMDLGTANEMKHEGAKDAILKNCSKP